jgi:hypothetical protein
VWQAHVRDFVSLACSHAANPQPAISRRPCHTVPLCIEEIEIGAVWPLYSCNAARAFVRDGDSGAHYVEHCWCQIQTARLRPESDDDKNRLTPRSTGSSARGKCESKSFAPWHPLSRRLASEASRTRLLSHVHSLGFERRKPPLGAAFLVFGQRRVLKARRWPEP